MSAGIGGLMQFKEGKRIKQVEGVPYEVGAIVKDVSRQTSRVPEEGEAATGPVGDEKV